MGLNPSTHITGSSQYNQFTVLKQIRLHIVGSSQYNQFTVLKQIKIGRKVKMLYIFQIWKNILVEQELLTLPEHLRSPPGCNGVRVIRSLVCRSLFVLLHLIYWSLYCLFFFHIRILITPLISPNSSSYTWQSHKPCFDCSTPHNHTNHVLTVLHLTII